MSMKTFLTATTRALWSVLPVFAMLAAAWAVNAVEGRVNPSHLGRTSIPIAADMPVPLHSRGQAVAVTGVAKADPIGDGMYVKPGPYLMVRREFERYGWLETMTASGPSYRQDWSYNLHDSGGFAEQAGHENPEPHVEKGTYLPPSLTLGRYSFKTGARSGLEVLSSGERLRLSPEIVDTGRLGGTVVGDLVYAQVANPSAPLPGDTRFSYYVIPDSAVVTVTGMVNGAEIMKGEGRYTLEPGGDMDGLAEATRVFNASQWRWRAVTAFFLLLAYAVVIRRRLRGSLRLMALPIAIVLTAGSSAAAMYSEGLRAFGLVVGPALLVGWWSLARPRPSQTAPAAPLDEAEKKP
jgi:hypothetical protein